MHVVACGLPACARQLVQQVPTHLRASRAMNCITTACSPKGLCTFPPVLFPPCPHQLMAAPKLTPAERRWRKKQQAAGGSQLAEGQPQAGEGADGRQGGRQGGGRQQQRGEGVGGRPGGRPAGRQQQQQQSGRQQQHGRQQGGLQPPQGGRPQQHHGMRAQQAGGTPSSGMGGRQGGLQPKQQQDW